MPLRWGLGAASGAGSAVLFLYTLLEFPIFFFFNDKLIIGKKANNNFFFFKLFRKPVGTNGKYRRESEITNSRQGRATEYKEIY